MVGTNALRWVFQLKLFYDSTFTITCLAQKKL